MKKRLGAIILVAAMLLSLFAFSAAATDISEFSDVDTSAWYYEYAKYVVENGYFKGTSVDTPKFEPETTMTRAMFVTVLSRIEAKNTAGFAVDDPAALTFTDVDDIPDWAAGAVKWAAENKIVEGYPDGTFLPGGHITRAEMAVMIKRYIDYHERKTLVTEQKEAKILPAFKDADQIPEWAAAAVEYCRQQGILIGFEDETMRPNADSTRAQIAAVAQRIDFVANYWTISYDANAAGVAAPAAQYVNKGYSVKLAAGISRAGYTFLGWAFSSTATAPDYAAGADYTPNANVVFYAVWRENATPPAPDTVTITYDANAPVDKILTYGVTPFVEKINEKVADVFGASQAAAAKAEGWVGNHSDDNNPKDIVSASYEELTIAGGLVAEVNAPEAQTDLVKNADVALRGAIQLEGFKFLGWAKNADATTPDYAAGETIPAEAMTLYAVWGADESYVAPPIEITASLSAGLGEDFMESVIITAGYAATVLTSEGAGTQAKNLYETVEAVMKELLTEYGIYDEAQQAWEVAKSSKTIRNFINKVYDLAYDYLTTKGPAYWANFKDENGYYFDKMTITVGGHADQELYADTNSGKGPTNFYTKAGDDKVAAKAISKYIAKDIEKQLQTINEPTSHITLTFDATVKFDVNDNGFYSNPNYKLTATLDLDGEGDPNGPGKLQFYYDKENKSYTVIATVKQSDVNALMAAAAEAVAPVADQKILDKLALDENYNGIKGSLYRSLVTGATPGEILDLLDSLDVGIDVNAVAADYGIDLAAHPAVKDYVLAALCDFYYNKALEIRSQYEENSSNWYKWSPESYVEDERPEAGFTSKYAVAMLQDAMTIPFGTLAKGLTKDVVVEKLGAIDTRFMDNVVTYINNLPGTGKITFNGYTFKKSDFTALRDALEAHNVAGAMQAIYDLIQNDALRNLCMKDFITSNATTGGQSAILSVRGHNRNATLRLVIAP